MPMIPSSLEMRRVRGSFGTTAANASHASGQQVGGLITFSDMLAPGRRPAVSSSEIRAAWLWDDTDQAAVAWRVALFRQDPTSGVTSTDNAALAMSDAVSHFSCGYIDFLSTNCMSMGGSKLYAGTMVNSIIPVMADDVDLDKDRSEDVNFYGLLQVLGTWAPGGVTTPVLDLLVARDA